MPCYAFAPAYLLQEEVEGARGTHIWDSAPPQDQDDAAPQQGGNRGAGADGDAAGGLDGRQGVTGKHDSSERSSLFLMRGGLRVLSASLPPEDLGTTTTPSTMFSKSSHTEHGRPREP